MLGQAKPTAKMKTSARFNLLKVLLQPKRPKSIFKTLQKLKILLQQIRFQQMISEKLKMKNGIAPKLRLCLVLLINKTLKFTTTERVSGGIAGEVIHPREISYICN